MTCQRFLILSASTGNGHLSAAKALEDELVARGYCVQSADVLDHCPRGFRAWYAGGYETLVRRRPEMWGHLYRSSDRPLFNFWFQTWLDWTFCKGLDRLIESFQPTYVLCTHSLPQPRLAALRRRFGFQIGVVVTDLHPHRMWLRGDPDRFFMPIRDSQAVLEARMPSSVGRILVTGIPINRAFCRSRPHGTAGGRPKVLLVAGAIGGGPLLGAAKALAALPIDLRVVAGRNRETHERLSSEFAAVDSVTVFGMLSQEEFAAQLAEADVLVSKPGGLTTFEALASGTAFVILEDLIIPGQEEDNMKFLVDCGAGEAARVDNVVDVVRRLIDAPDRLAAMRHAAVDNAFPNAARDIVDSLASGK